MKHSLPVVKTKTLCLLCFYCKILWDRILSRTFIIFLSKPDVFQYTKLIAYKLRQFLRQFKTVTGWSKQSGKSFFEGKTVTSRKSFFEGWSDTRETFFPSKNDFPNCFDHPVTVFLHCLKNWRNLCGIPNLSLQTVSQWI